MRTRRRRKYPDGGKVFSLGYTHDPKFYNKDYLKALLRDTDLPEDFIKNTQITRAQYNRYLKDPASAPRELQELFGSPNMQRGTMFENNPHLDKFTETRFGNLPDEALKGVANRDQLAMLRDTKVARDLSFDMGIGAPKAQRRRSLRSASLADIPEIQKIPSKKPYSDKSLNYAPVNELNWNNKGESITRRQGKSGIKIKPENRGKFTRWAKRHGYSSPQAAANAVMKSKGSHRPEVVKMANFAKNFGGKKKGQSGLGLPDISLPDFAPELTGGPDIEGIGNFLGGISGGPEKNFWKDNADTLLPLVNTASNAALRLGAVNRLPSSFTPSTMKVDPIPYRSRVGSIQRQNEAMFNRAGEQYSNITGSAANAGRVGAFSKLVQANNQAAIADDQARGEHDLGQQRIQTNVSKTNALLSDSGRRYNQQLQTEGIQSGLNAVDATSQEVQGIIANARLGDAQSRSMLFQLLSTSDPEQLAESFGLDIEELMELAGVKSKYRSRIR